MSRSSRTAQQALANHWLGDYVDDLLPGGEIDVALGRGDDPDRPRRLHVAAAEQDQVLGRVDEGVDDEDLGPVLLGDLVHLRVGAALDQEGVIAAADRLQAGEEVGGQLDLVVLDTLEAHIGGDRPLVTGALGAQGHDRRRVLSVARLHSHTQE
jgi:hypothetical protein